MSFAQPQWWSRWPALPVPSKDLRWQPALVDGRWHCCGTGLVALCGAVVLASPPPRESIRCGASNVCTRCSLAWMTFDEPAWHKWEPPKYVRPDGTTVERVKVHRPEGWFDIGSGMNKRFHYIKRCEDKTLCGRHDAQKFGYRPWKSPKIDLRCASCKHILNPEVEGDD